MPVVPGFDRCRPSRGGPFGPGCVRRITRRERYVLSVLARLRGVLGRPQTCVASPPAGCQREMPQSSDRFTRFKLDDLEVQCFLRV